VAAEVGHVWHGSVSAMADRPGRDGPEDGPDFNWLYGGRGRSDDAHPEATRAIRHQPRPDDESTRVMSAQPRETSRPAPPPAAPRPSAPSPRTSNRGGAAGSRFRRPRFWIRIAMALVLLWIVYLVTVPVWTWQSVDKVAWEPDGDRPGDQPGTTYLMVGSDSREGLSDEERKELGTGDASGGRTDTIMVLHTGAGPNLLMSIPRDSPSPQGKINAAYAAGGPTELVDTVEGLTGIRIDHYVEIGMGGVVGIVDAVGGIEICPKQPINDPKAKLRIKKGCQEVDGKTALGYSRSRASALSDLARVQQQREVVSAIGAKVVSPWSVLNPIRYWRLNNALPDFFTFGEGMGPIRAAQWAMAMTKVNGEDGLTCTVPLANGSAEWDPDRSEQMFLAIIEDDTESIGKDLCTPSGLPPGVTGN
jgi:LCP family protein required for cell wall assembly